VLNHTGKQGYQERFVSLGYRRPEQGGNLCRATPGATTMTEATHPMSHQFLRALRRLRAIAESGLFYGKDEYDRVRYAELGSISQELIAMLADAAPQQVREILPVRKVPATPVLDARAFVVHEGKVLLVKESVDLKWSLPGGWVEVNESLRESIEREVWEESGLRCTARRLLAVWDRDRHGHTPLAVHCYKLVVYCEVMDVGAFSANSETLEAGFFAVDALPELSLGRVTRAQIETAFKMVQEGTNDAQFD
jgi:ADP-ribose pyrophosphatase YjhB (NUDIX family)